VPSCVGGSHQPVGANSDGPQTPRAQKRPSRLSWAPGLGPECPGLNPSEAFATSATGFETYLCHPAWMGLLPENVKNFFDDSHAPTDILKEASDSLVRRQSGIDSHAWEGVSLISAAHRRKVVAGRKDRRREADLHCISQLPASVQTPIFGTSTATFS
jgi:hypothetical protein